MNQAIEQLWQRALLRTFLKGVAGLIYKQNPASILVETGFSEEITAPRLPLRIAEAPQRK
jgi:hypothetical protein